MRNEVIQALFDMSCFYLDQSMLLQLINLIKNLTNSYDKCGVLTRFWDSVECPFLYPLWLNDEPD